MTQDEFEKRLQRQPLRQVPADWRQEILSAAQQASLPEHAPRTTHPAHPRRSLLSTINSQLSTLLWPHPAAWAGLAAVWLLILGFNQATREATPLVAKRASPVSPQVFMAYREQERLLGELLGPRETPVAERPKAEAPRPRSEGGRQMLMAQNGIATSGPREAFGVRGACSRFGPAVAARQRQQAGRTPNASRGSLSIASVAAGEQLERCGA
jgi:hypothetical protein